MHISKNRLAPIHCASDDATRYNLNSLRIDGKRIEATNGHVLARVELGEPCPDIEAFSLPLPDAKPIAAKIKRKPRRAGALRPVAVVDVAETNANGHVKLELPDGSPALAPKADPGYGDFPNTDQVFPKGEPEYRIILSAAVLEAMVATVRQFTDTAKGDGAGMAFEFHGSTDACRVTVPDLAETGDELVMVAMPMRK